MEPRTPGAEAPLKYTKESFLGVRDAWISFAAKRISQAAATLEHFAEKLPAAVKSKIPIKAKAQGNEAAGSNSANASAPS